MKRKLLVTLFLLSFCIVGLFAQGVPGQLKGYAYYSENDTPHSAENFGYVIYNSMMGPASARHFNVPSSGYAELTGDHGCYYTVASGLFEIQLSNIQSHAMFAPMIKVEFYGDDVAEPYVIEINVNDIDPTFQAINYGPINYGGSTGPVLPSWATLTSPANLATGLLPFGVTLNWDYEGEAVTGYEVFVNSANIGDVTDGTSYTFAEALEYGSTNTWSIKPYIEEPVRATVRNAKAKTSAVRERLYPEGEMSGWTFTIMDAPVPPAVTTPGPGNGATGVAITGATLSWVQPAFAYTAQVTYDVYLSTSSTFVPGDMIASGLTSPTFTITEALAYGTIYYWQVVATFDDANLMPARARVEKVKTQTVRTEHSSTSDTWDFGTEEQPEPTQPILVAPANNETDVAVAVFEWELDNPAVTADNFILYYGTDPDPVANGTQVILPYTKRHKTIQLAKDGTMYYWTVKAVRADRAAVRVTPKGKVRMDGTSSNRVTTAWSFTMLNEATTTPDEPGTPTPPQNDDNGQEEIQIPPIQIQLPGAGGNVVVDATIDIQTTGADNGNALGNVTVTLNEDPVNEGLYHPENVALSYTVNVDPPATDNPAFVTVTLRLSYAGLGYIPNEVLWFNGSVWEVVGGVTWDDPFAVFTVNIPVNTRAGSAEFTFNDPSAGSGLPVTWDGHFNAIFVESTELVELTWKTISESSMQGYQVYRSNSSILNDAIAYGQEILASNNIHGSEYKFEDTEVETGETYYYWIESRELLSANPTFHGPVKVEIEKSGAPEFIQITELKDAYPNPFNPDVTIMFSVKEGEEARLEIFNVLGQKVKDFGVYAQSTTEYKQVWHGKDDNGTAVGSGVYFYRLSSPSKTVIKKMMLLK